MNRRNVFTALAAMVGALPFIVRPRSAGAAKMRLLKPWQPEPPSPYEDSHLDLLKPNSTAIVQMGPDGEFVGVTPIGPDQEVYILKKGEQSSP